MDVTVAVGKARNVTPKMITGASHHAAPRARRDDIARSRRFRSVTIAHQIPSPTVSKSPGAIALTNMPAPMAMTIVTAARREHAPGGDRAGCEAAQATPL